MNGFIRATRKGWLLVATAAGVFAGCQTFESAGPCGTACSKDGGCGSSGCKKPFVSQLKDDLCDFDSEELYPDHCWPEQYNFESRRRVNYPFGVQMDNGNAVEVTIWTHYFNIEKGKEYELTEAGLNRIAYLAHKKPFVIPDLLLQTSFDRDLDQKRIQSVIAAAARYSLEPLAWQVYVINEKPNGLFGVEGPKAITKMVGIGPNPPAYERNIKQTFLTSSTGGGSGGGGS